MAETEHYGLYISDDRSESFLGWSQKVNGETDSNMTKIDGVLAEKADKSRSVTVTLLADGWVGSEKPYTQTVSVSGLGAEQNGQASLAQGAAPEQETAAIKAVLSVSAQADGSLTIKASGQKPSVDIPIEVTLLG